jgi:hypothetical protein
MQALECGRSFAFDYHGPWVVLTLSASSEGLMVAAVDIAGHIYGQLLVIERHVVSSAAGKARWLCQCSCGSFTIVVAGTLRSGETLSCGHLNFDPVSHGGYRHPEYRVWNLMRQRCHNPKNTHYASYGGRGISVCDRWRKSYAAFNEDMGRRPFLGAQIDRIDNNGNYEPGNCRWATRKQNCRNQRKTRFLAYRGEVRSMPEWCEILGLHYGTVKHRVLKGWSPERALSPTLGAP